MGKKRIRLDEEEQDATQSAGGNTFNPHSLDVELAHDERQLMIDKHKLDDELIQQPDRYRSAAEHYAMAVSLRDEAKDKMKVVEAQLYLKHRQSFDAKDKKPTEAEVNAMVTVDPLRIKARNEHLQRQLAADQWEALKDSFSQRSYVLKDLVALHLAGYFASSSVSAPANDVLEARADKAKRAMAERARERREATK